MDRTNVRLTGLQNHTTGGDIVEFSDISGQAYYIVSVSGYNSGGSIARVN